MRVTSSMIARQTLHNLSASLRRLDRYNDQLSTGRRINLPSDDPAGTGAAMRLETAILETEQYLENVEDAISWLEATDAALNQISKTVQRARELAVYGANDTLTSDSRRALADEVEQLLEDLIQVGNLKFDHRYMFGGENTLAEPFSAQYDAGGRIAGFSYNGTTGGGFALEQEIGPGATMRVSIHGDDAIVPAIEALIDLRDKLRAGDPKALADESTLGQIDDALDTILRWRAEAGARANRLELVRGRLQETHTNLTRLLSERVDVDIAEAIMNLKMEENVYRMALASGARIIQPTLMDFLR